MCQVSCKRTRTKGNSDMSIVISRTGAEGNAFSIMGVVRNILRNLDEEDRWEEVQKDMMSGDYEHLIEVAERETNGILEITE